MVGWRNAQRLFWIMLAIYAAPERLAPSGFGLSLDLEVHKIEELGVDAVHRGGLAVIHHYEAIGLR